MADFTPTPEQQVAIGHEGNMVITACPGSGKTAVVVEKIRRKLPGLKAYQGVIDITFTVKASEELKSRCKKNAFDAKQSFFGTIDSFCLKEIIYPFISRVWGRTEHELKPVFRNDLSQPERNALNGFDGTTRSFHEYMPEFIRQYQSGRILMNATGLIARYVLDHSSACRRYLAAKYDSVFIDEYQDSSESQHHLFTRLVSLGMTGIAVGDEDQSIYGFRGGSREHIEELKNDDGYAVFPILTNHRCHQSISNYARRLLDSQCALVPEDDLRVYRGHYTGTNVDLARLISRWVPNIKNNFEVANNSDIAILVKNNASVTQVSEGMTVPYRIYVDNPLTDIGGEHARLCTDLLRYRFDNQLTAESVLADNLSLPLARKKTCSIRELIKQVRRCDIEELPTVFDLVAIAISSSGLPQTVLAALTTVLQNRDLVALYQPVNKEEVQVMTLHKSKGLEFDVVLHLDLYGWIFPIGNPDQYQEAYKPPSWEQELNLHYVGITRAKKACILLTSGSRYSAQGHLIPSVPSIFLQLPRVAGLYQNL